MSVSVRLQALIDSHVGLSANQLAERTGVPQPTVTRILNGESDSPRSKTLEPIAAYFGVSVAYLRGEETAVAPPLTPMDSHEARLLHVYRRMDSRYRELYVELGENFLAWSDLINKQEPPQKK